ncbi:potassium:hydrogen antiporter [Coprinopsis cinerea okayama7|uniref:Potassium:hydrogen antiporter n=1 Tax=Coprinopsis cinerea (strain Okayama-7 / 130 / ATCC MYA-4618 / FGSC 9003) TaxID=240176 RepID=A8N7R1_COPC7|nr:potassium:hydrogen antiporter [Coprinopsis cinerea okayama7\|eukprot:XP_001830867.2 potassium:hydrogen antiporter [Coprinopsis cinerea okayama7\
MHHIQGRIPGFTEHIFPEASRGYLGLVADIGLCLFLFLVGLEIDAGVIQRNAKLSATVALAGMILPFAIGSGLAVSIYKEFIDPRVEFTHFMLFTGVAYSITAFPVLCRILTELKLLDTTVGIVVLSAGVGNDIIGWTLLALSVALVNAGTGLTALYILLICVAWTLIVLFPMKWVMKWLARVTGSIENGPTVFFMTVTMLVLFGSAFFTDIIGVHAIFGAFLAGLIVPREGGLAIALTEKLEDMVSIIFLPLYFTLSGLSTDLGLLDSGKTWAYTVAIITTAFVGKFGGCFLGARYVAGFDVRESAAIGSLMSCKGLVELIVLNVGLSAKILSRVRIHFMGGILRLIWSKRVFSMFVLEALVLTFVTTPLVTWLYPPNTRVRVAAHGSNFKHVGDGEAGEEETHPPSRAGARKSRFTIVLDKFEHLSGMMALTQLVNPSPPTGKEAPQPSSAKMVNPNSQQVSIEALRVMELTDRVSAVMKSSAAESVLHNDPLLSAFRMFGGLNQINIDPSLVIVKFEQMASSIAEQARNYGSDLILIPWLSSAQDTYANVPHHIEPGQSHFEPTTAPNTPKFSAHSGTPRPTTAPNTPKSPIPNPFDMLFKASTHQVSASVIHSQFVRSVFSQATTDVALFVDQSMLEVIALLNGRQHLFLPFFGGPDDRLALEFVVQLVETNTNITATVARITRRDVGDVLDGALKRPEDVNVLTISSNVGGSYPDTIYPHHDSATKLQSETADNVLWARFAKLRAGASGASENGSSQGPTWTNPRIEFKEIDTLAPLHVALQEAERCSSRLLSASTGDQDGEVRDDSKATPSPSEIRARTSIAIKVQQPTEDEIDFEPAETPVTPTTPTTPRVCVDGPLMVVTGRSRRLAAEDHRIELKELMEEHGRLGSEVRKTIGDAASAFVIADVGSGVLVLQAATCM